MCFILANANAVPIVVQGTGATFPSPLLNNWIGIFEQRSPTPVNVSYITSGDNGKH
jgi:hypothetical protein